MTMNTEWNTSFWGLCLRLLTLAFWLVLILGALRLMGWADTDMRKLPAIEELTPHGVHGTLERTQP